MKMLFRRCDSGLQVWNELMAISVTCASSQSLPSADHFCYDALCRKKLHPKVLWYRKRPSGENSLFHTYSRNTLLKCFFHITLMNHALLVPPKYWCYLNSFSSIICAICLCSSETSSGKVITQHPKRPENILPDTLFNIGDILRQDGRKWRVNMGDNARKHRPNPKSPPTEHLSRHHSHNNGRRQIIYVIRHTSLAANTH